MILYIINDINKSNTFELLFKRLGERDVNFAIVNLSSNEQTPFFKFCNQNNITVKELNSKNRIYRFIFIVFQIIIFKPKVVHTHLLDSGLLGGFASWLMRIPVRVYTRHHGDQHVFYHKHAVKYDKLVNFFHTDIITLSKSHYEQVISYEMPRCNVHIVPHAFDSSNLRSLNSLGQDLKEKYKIDSDNFNIIVNSRWTELKGLQYIIPAFKKFNEIIPNSVLWFFNSSGDYEKNINLLLQTLKPKSYHTVIFENEILPIYDLMDVFIHVPIRKTAESFGQVYIEAMGLGLPCIFTMSGIANDICVDGENCLVVPYKNSDEIFNKLIEVKNNPEIALKLGLNAKKVLSNFSLDKHINSLMTIYHFTS